MDDLYRRCRNICLDLCSSILRMDCDPKNFKLNYRTRVVKYRVPFQRNNLRRHLERLVGWPSFSHERIFHWPKMVARQQHTMGLGYFGRSATTSILKKVFISIRWLGMSYRTKNFAGMQRTKIEESMKHLNFLLHDHC